MKKIFYKDLEQIEVQTSQLNSFCSRIEENLERLEELNKINHTFGKEDIFEVTTFIGKDEIESERTLVRRAGAALHPASYGALAQGTRNNIMGLFGYKESTLHGVFEGKAFLKPAPRPIIGDKKLEKEDLIFDYKKNKVIPTKEILNRIEESNTYYTENATQEKLAETMRALFENLAALDEIHQEAGLYFSVFDFVRRAVISNETLEMDIDFVAKNILPEFK